MFTGINLSTSLGSTFPDHIGSLFGNHHDRGVRVTASDRWHHGCVNDPNTINPPNSEAFVDHGHIIDTHSARTDRVKDRGRDVTSSGHQFLVTLELSAWLELLWRVSL